MMRFLDVLMLSMALVSLPLLPALYGLAGFFVGVGIAVCVFLFLVTRAPEGETYYD